MVEKQRVSSSKMDLYYDWCEKKYRLRYIEKIPSPFVSKSLRIGSGSHNGIEKFWNNFKLTNLDDFPQDIDQYYYKFENNINLKIKDVEISSKIKLYFSNFLNFQTRRLNNYIDVYGKDYELVSEYFFPLLNEKRGAIRIVSGIQFDFVIDALFKIPKGKMLIDWKTDKDCNESQFYTHVPQLNRYSGALPYIMESCNFIGVFFLKESLFFNKKCSTTYSLEDEVLGFVRDLKMSNFSKVPKEDCWKCSNSKWDCEYYPEICDGSL